MALPLDFLWELKVCHHAICRHLPIYKRDLSITPGAGDDGVERPSQPRESRAQVDVVDHIGQGARLQVQHHVHGVKGVQGHRARFRVIDP